MCGKLFSFIPVREYRSVEKYLISRLHSFRNAYVGMKIKQKKHNSVKEHILGKKITKGNFFAVIFCSVIFITCSIWEYHRQNKLTNTHTITVFAKITDIYMWAPGGGGYRVSRPRLKCEYYLHNLKYIKIFDLSESMWNNVHIGDCIEIKLSLENEHIFEWNREKGTFKCE